MKHPLKGSGPKITTALDNHLFDENGNKYLDLCMGYGSVALGHSYGPINELLVQQLHKYSSPGFFETDVFEEAKITLETFIPGNNLVLHGLYPSGATAIEMALRIAMMHSRKQRIISFMNSMHGKTNFTSQLGFDSSFQNKLSIEKLPFISDCSEEDILDKIRTQIKNRNVAAVIVEPIQMSAGGNQASADFYREIRRLTTKYGVLLVFDEILTGCYRTGSKFLYERFGLIPDIVVVGKALANGFPVSALLHKTEIKITREMNPGNTYFNHPLACKSIVATIKELQNPIILKNIECIEQLIIANLGSYGLKGCGALWNLDLGTPLAMTKFVNDLKNERIVVSYYDRYIRLLPSYNINLAELEQACLSIRNYL